MEVSHMKPFNTTEKIQQGFHYTQYLPGPWHEQLTRKLEGKVVSVDAYVASLEEVPCIKDVLCPICRLDAGEETLDRFYDPNRPGHNLTSEVEAFRDQITLVTTSCCRQPVHRGCLMNCWFDVTRLNPDIQDMAVKTTCPLCRQKVCDSPGYCFGAEMLANLYFECSKAMAEPPLHQPQALPPGHTLDFQTLALRMGLCFQAGVDAESHWATSMFSICVAAAAQLRVVEARGKPLYCRGQIFALVLGAAEEVVRVRSGEESIGEVMKTGRLPTKVMECVSFALLKAVELYTAHCWEWYWRPHRRQVHEVADG